MSVPADEMKELLQRLLEKQTFSLEAAEGIAKLREQNASLKMQLERSQEREKEFRERSGGLAAVLEKAEDELKDLRTRERNIAAHETAVAVANARAETMKEMAGLIFRNTEVRRSMVGQAPQGSSASQSSYMPSTVPIHEDVKISEG